VAVLAILVIGVALSWLAVAAGFDPLVVAGGSQPAAIWGPALGFGATMAVAVLLVGIGAWARGGRRLAVLALWAVFLAAATHRIVERSDGVVIDRWLGVAVQTLADDPDRERDTGRCTVGRWLARCRVDRTGFASVSLLPMAPLSPGQWER
jgi:hypothetical protein